MCGNWSWWWTCGGGECKVFMNTNIGSCWSTQVLCTWSKYMLCTSFEQLYKIETYQYRWTFQQWLKYTLWGTILPFSLVLVQINKRKMPHGKCTGLKSMYMLLKNLFFIFRFPRHRNKSTFVTFKNFLYKYFVYHYFNYVHNKCVPLSWTLFISSHM